MSVTTKKKCIKNSVKNGKWKIAMLWQAQYIWKKSSVEKHKTFGTRKLSMVLIIYGK